MVTTVQIQEETWERLDERKQRGDSFDDVIVRALDTEERTD